MKKIIYTFILVLLAGSLSATKVVVDVPGMVCQMCVQGMRKGFKDVVKDARKDVQVDLENKKVSLVLSKPISDQEIKKRVKEAGYNAMKITRTQDQTKKK